MTSLSESPIMKVAINICEEFAEQWETQARGGDNTGASDHRADAARQIIAELRNVNTAPQQPTQSGDALTRDLLETLQMMVKHFTKTPSTLADSKARGKAHEVIAKAYEQIGYTAPTAAPEKGDGRDAWQPIDTAPKFGEPIDVWGRYGRKSECVFGKPTYAGGLHWIYEAGYDSNGPVFEVVVDPTHWMPPPAAPAAANDKEKQS